MDRPGSVMNSTSAVAVMIQAVSPSLSSGGAWAKATLGANSRARDQMDTRRRRGAVGMIDRLPGHPWLITQANGDPCRAGIYLDWRWFKLVLLKFAPPGANAQFV